MRIICTCGCHNPLDANPMAHLTSCPVYTSPLQKDDDEIMDHMDCINRHLIQIVERLNFIIQRLI